LNAGYATINMFNMSTQELFVTCFAYHAWANQRILDCAARLDPADYYAESAYSHGSLHNLFFHIARGDYIWRHVIQYGQRPQTPLQEQECPNLAELRTRWQEEMRAMQDLLASWSNAEIDSDVQVIESNGAVYPLNRRRMLMHLLLHGMQHRSEAAALLTSYGQNPGDLDFIFFEE